MSRPLLLTRRGNTLSREFFHSFTPVESIKVVTAVTRRIRFPFVTVINRLKLLKKRLASTLLFGFLGLLLEN
jgi:hypothetical protein